MKKILFAVALLGSLSALAVSIQRPQSLSIRFNPAQADTPSLIAARHAVGDYFGNGKLKTILERTSMGTGELVICVEGEHSIVFGALSDALESAHIDRSQRTPDVRSCADIIREDQCDGGGCGPR